MPNPARAYRGLLKTRKCTHQEQLVIGIRFAPQHAVIGVGQGFELVIFIGDAPRYLCFVQGEGLADKCAAHCTECGAGHIANRAHAQGVGEHLKTSLEPRDLQAVGNVIAAAPMGGARFIAGGEVGVVRGEVDGIDMGLEPGPTAETQLLGDRPLCLGQGCVRVLGFQVWQQFLGALALLLKVEAAIGVDVSGHTISLHKPVPLQGWES